MLVQQWTTGNFTSRSETGAAGTAHFEPGGVAFWHGQIGDPAQAEQLRLDNEKPDPRGWGQLAGRASQEVRRESITLTGTDP